MSHKEEEIRSSAISMPDSRGLAHTVSTAASLRVMEIGSGLPGTQLNAGVNGRADSDHKRPQNFDEIEFANSIDVRSKLFDDLVQFSLFPSLSKIQIKVLM